MIVRISLLASLLVLSTLAFDCSPDTILRMATNKREKQLERECHEEKTAQAKCETKDNLEKSWKEFQDVSEKYKEAVAECRKYVEEKSRPKRTVQYTDVDHKLYGNAGDFTGNDSEQRGKRNDGNVLDGDMGEPDDVIVETHDHSKRRRHHEGRQKLGEKHRESLDHLKHGLRVRRGDEHDPNDPNVDHTGHNHRRKRSTDDDPSDTTIDHTGHNHRRKRNHEDDPNDTTIDHTGHNHRRRRHNDDPNDTTIDHSGHNHRRRRSGDHDPNDPNVDHTGHNHRMRRSHDDDPNDTTIDHTGHNHRRRRSGDHDPNDPNVDHTGHNHRLRRHHHASRIRRTVCATAGHDQLSAISSKFSQHCERHNICLPDEDLPKGKQQDDIVALQKLRAKKYSEYLNQVSRCYGKL